MDGDMNDRWVTREHFGGVTHLPLNKMEMVTISYTIFSDAFCEWKVLYLIKMSKFVRIGPIHNSPALVKGKAWRRVVCD